MRFSIRDLLWLFVVVSLVAVWRSDLARQEAVYREMLKTRFSNDNEMRDIAIKARTNPELLAALKEFGTAEAKLAKSSFPEKRALHRQYVALKEMARDIPMPTKP